MITWYSTHTPYTLTQTLYARFADGSLTYVGKTGDQISALDAARYGLTTNAGPAGPTDGPPLLLPDPPALYSALPPTAANRITP